MFFFLYSVLIFFEVLWCKKHILGEMLWRQQLFKYLHCAWCHFGRQCDGHTELIWKRINTKRQSVTSLLSRSTAAVNVGNHSKETRLCTHSERKPSKHINVVQTKAVGPHYVSREGDVGIRSFNIIDRLFASTLHICTKKELLVFSCKKFIYA